MHYQGAMFLRRAGLFCRIGSEFGDATVQKLLDEMHSEHFDLNVFKDALQRARDFRKLAQRNREWVIVSSGF